MPYPHVTQFETLERRARLIAASAPTPGVWHLRARRRLRLRRRLTPQPC
jgi:hypothetical protein